ncbi:hypothetical protein Q9L42_012000 [Methylomarinum sp. Ch1-1]|uniref:Uncharacterized protein n=1 Tax=Methylomarinum roseum TaxID=3067653 RepID=A0AAU7NQ45_9GAMM|nr:hypothetical protein [Methylomarinum sp. Ch1-1]MDP4520975.1 hypothetical protein [Methylomarinum sp. Ch1-1]
MKHGLEALKRQCNSRHPTHQALAAVLMRDLQHCRCYIYGQQAEEHVLLAVLGLQAGSLDYEKFDQRIDFMLAGEIIRDDCVPLTYRLQGDCFSITGRCSMLPRVCGVDWYIGGGYSGKAGDQARLKFKVSIKEVLRQKTKD